MKCHITAKVGPPYDSSTLHQMSGAEIKEDTLPHSSHHHQQVFPQQQHHLTPEGQQQQHADIGETSVVNRISSTKFADDLPGTQENESSSGFFGVKRQNGAASSAKERFLLSEMQQKEGFKSHEHFFPPSHSDSKNALPQNAFDLEVLGTALYYLSNPTFPSLRTWHEIYVFSR